MWADKNAGRQAARLSRHTYKQTDRQKNSHADIQVEKNDRSAKPRAKPLWIMKLKNKSIA